MDKQNNSFTDFCDIEEEEKILQCPNYSKQAKKFPQESNEGKPLAEEALQDPIIPGKRSNSMDKENPDKHVKIPKVNKWAKLKHGLKAIVGFRKINCKKIVTPVFHLLGSNHRRN